MGVLIPVSRSNGSSLGTQIKDKNEFTAELVNTPFWIGIKQFDN